MDGNIIQLSDLKWGESGPVSGPLLQLFERADLTSRQLLLTASCLALAVSVARMAEDGLAITISTDEDPDYWPGVGVCLVNSAGELFVEQPSEGTVVAWRLPQGRMRPGESPLEAAQRVLKEHCGVSNVDPLCQSYGWLRYEFPALIAQSLWGAPWRGPKQKWVALKHLGDDGSIRPNASAGWSSWRWAPLEELSFLVCPLKHVGLVQIGELMGPTSAVRERPASPGPEANRSVALRW